MKLSDKQNNSSLLRSGTFLSFLTFFSRILGLIREMVKSRFLGTSPLADAFTVSFLIPNLLRRLFAENSMTVAFIPTFKELIEKPEDESQKQKEMKEFLSSIFSILTFFTSLVVIIGIIFTPLILHVLFPKLEAHNSAILLTKIMFPYLVFISIAAFFQGILNGVKVFSPSGFTPILFNISVIGATYILTKPLGNPAIAMSIGVVFGGFLQAMFQLPYVIKNRFFFSFTSLKNALHNPYTKKTLRLIAPTIIGMAAYQINDLVSTSLATGYGVGIASSLQYSLRLQELLLGVFVVSISSVILPDLSSYAIKTDWASFEKLFLQSMKIIAVITIPASFFAFFSSEEIVSIIYKSHKFNADSVNLP
ncbi:MAG: murein biosynthesis integral membrane protein MurJ, partial [Treponema sp.]